MSFYKFFLISFASLVALISNLQAQDKRGLDKGEDLGVSNEIISFFNFSSSKKIEKKEKGKSYSGPVVVLDWGGVMVHSSHPRIYHFLKKYFGFSSEEVAKFLSSLKFCRNKNSDKEFWEEYTSQNKIKLPPNWFSDLDKTKLACQELNKEMFELILRLKKEKIKVVLFSDVSKETADLLRKYGFYDIFDETILSYEIGFKKPDPEAYDILLSKIGAKPSDCIFIDDKKKNIKAAEEKGIIGIVFKSYDDLQNKLLPLLNKKRILNNK